MQRRYATTGLIIEASHKLQERVGMLSKPERGAAMRALGTATSRMASCRMKAVRFRSELVIVTLGLAYDTNSAVTSGPDYDPLWTG